MKRVVLLVMSVLAGACGLVEDPTPEQVRLVIAGDIDKPVQLVVSTRFVAGVNDRGETLVELFISDTLVTSLPYSKVYEIRTDQRFFVEMARINNDLETIGMQVFVDERRIFGDTTSLVAGARPLRFVYMFNVPVTRVIEVL
jgi:hypothetical protein